MISFIIWSWWQKKRDFVQLNLDPPCCRSSSISFFFSFLVTNVIDHNHHNLLFHESQVHFNESVYISVLNFSNKRNRNLWKRTLFSVAFGAATRDKSKWMRSRRKAQDTTSLSRWPRHLTPSQGSHPSCAILCMDARRSAANSFALRCYEHEEVRHSRFTFALVVVVVVFF